MPAWLWITLGCWVFILLVGVMLAIRKGSTIIKGEKSPGGGTELFVETDFIQRFPYMDDGRSRE